jgi:eukaryotic-like serine/threonine-protein kinase
MIAPGTKVGGFEVLARIGAGAMGEVYRARDLRLGREVALKILPAAFHTDSDRMSRFEREAQALAALSHPNIATIHGTVDSESLHALVMELVDVETLADRIKRTAPMAVGDVISIGSQIADALDAAHERGVIHRDLKPANIKLTRDESVKVLDFGLATFSVGAVGNVLHDEADTIRLTETGVILGTAPYMSPEQARGLSVDKRTDMGVRLRDLRDADWTTRL